MAKKIAFDPTKAPAPVELNEGTMTVLERADPKARGEARKMIGVKIPVSLYDDIESLKTIARWEGETLTLTDIIVECLTAYRDEHKDILTEYEEKLRR